MAGKLVQNERIKLFATAVNNIGVATVVTAFVTPIVGFLYSPPSATVTAWWPLIGLAWLLVGLCLHVFAQLALGRLQE